MSMDIWPVAPIVLFTTEALLWNLNHHILFPRLEKDVNFPGIKTEWNPAKTAGLEGTVPRRTINTKRFVLLECIDFC